MSFSSLQYRAHDGWPSSFCPQHLPLIFSNISAEITLTQGGSKGSNEKLHSNVQLSPLFQLIGTFLEKKRGGGGSSIIWPVFVSCTDMVIMNRWEKLTKEKGLCRWVFKPFWDQHHAKGWLLQSFAHAIHLFITLVQHIYSIPTFKAYTSKTKI